MKALEGGKISPRQLYTLLVLAHLETTTSILPNLITAFADRDSWAAVLLAILAALPLGLLVAWLGKRFPGRTLIQYSQFLLGKPLGFLVSLLYIWFFIHIASLVVRESAVGFNLSVLPLTPPLVLISILVLLAVITARGGIEVIGRLAESSFMFIIFFTLVALFLPLNMAHPEYLQPVLALGTSRIMRAALLPLGLLGEIIAANMVFPYLTKPEKATSLLLYAVLSSGAIILLFALITVAVFGPTTDNFTIPPFKLARMISIGNFLERIEVIILAIWTIVALIKTAFYLWISMLGTAQLFNLRGYRELASPLGLLIIVLSILVYKNFTEAIHFYTPQNWGLYIVGIEAGLLLLLCGAALLGKKKGETIAKNPKS